MVSLSILNLPKLALAALWRGLNGPNIIQTETFKVLELANCINILLYPLYFPLTVLYLQRNTSIFNWCEWLAWCCCVYSLWLALKMLVSPQNVHFPFVIVCCTQVRVYCGQHLQCCVFFRMDRVFYLGYIPIYLGYLPGLYFGLKSLFFLNVPKCVWLLSSLLVSKQRELL
jgi:hypothetical protein